MLIKLFQLMHEYFPERYFKYILIGVAIGIVVQVLGYLLKTLAFPKKPWLLRHYREAYERFACGVCGGPIRRGPLKYAAWTAQGPAASFAVPGGSPDETYTCPACGTMLYETCTACQGIRHALLPHCQKCGAAKEIPLVPAQV